MKSVSRMLLGLAMVCLPATAYAHAVVFPKTSTTGAHEKYVLRVPNEKESPTTRIEIRFADGVRVSSFADVPGWQLEVLTDSAKRIIGAAWTGSLAPHRFVELPFVATNPAAAGSIVWPTFQTYADGERVEWTGAGGSKRPASTTVISAPATAASTPSSSSAGSFVPWISLGIALAALGLSLRRAPQSN